MSDTGSAANAAQKRCSSRGSFYGKRWRCAREAGHESWHEHTVSSESPFTTARVFTRMMWDAAGGYQVDVEGGIEA